MAFRAVEFRSIAHFFDGEHLSLLHDVTDRESERVAAEAVASTKDRLLAKCSRSLSQAPRAYLLTDRKGTIEYANNAAGRLLNMPTSFLFDKDLLHFIARGDTRAFRALVERAPSIETRGEFECRIRPRRLGIIRAALSVAVVEGGGIGWIIRDRDGPLTAMNGSPGGSVSAPPVAGDAD